MMRRQDAVVPCWSRSEGRELVGCCLPCMGIVWEVLDPKNRIKQIPPLPLDVKRKCGSYGQHPDRVIVYAFGRSAELHKIMAGKGMERVEVYWWQRSFLAGLGETLAPVVRWRLDWDGEMITVNGVSGRCQQVPPP